MNYELAKLLRENSYPGRGIVIGRSEDGRHAVIAYFIMGRSENSRNRIFTEDGEGIRTQAYDPAKLTDPSLIIYAPVRVLHRDGRMMTIVTNGDQTDTVYDGLSQGLDFSQALRSRTFEPDGPNYTPRISGLVEGLSYTLSILKSADGDPSSVRRYTFEYPEPLAGQGHFIHTYRCDGNPLPSFEGEPEPVAIRGGIDAFSREIWESLNEDNRVSLFVRFIETDSGRWETRIINRYQ